MLSVIYAELYLCLGSQISSSCWMSLFWMSWRRFLQHINNSSPIKIYITGTKGGNVSANIYFILFLDFFLFLFQNKRETKISSGHFFFLFAQQQLQFWPNVIKTFLLSFSHLSNKLECLSVSDTSTLPYQALNIEGAFVIRTLRRVCWASKSDLCSTTKCDQNHITRTYKFGHA
jgi:hypothetical protein